MLDLESFKLEDLKSDQKWIHCMNLITKTRVLRSLTLILFLLFAWLIGSAGDRNWMRAMGVSLMLISALLLGNHAKGIKCSKCGTPVLYNPKFQMWGIAAKECRKCHLPLNVD